jgi:hypothetical protein
MKFKPGLLVGAASGKIGSAVASHNRYGTYFRVWVKPVNGLTGYQIVARDRLIEMSQDWKTLTAEYRAAWDQWAQVNPIVDRLGMKQILTGHAAYVQINCTLKALEQLPIDLPPVGAAPTPFTACSLTADIGAGAVSIVFTPTPTSASLGIMCYMAVTSSTSRKYMKNLMKLASIAGGPTTSPLDIQAGVQLRLGTLQVGQFLQGMIYVVGLTTGLRSAPSYVSAVVTST